MTNRIIEVNTDASVSHRHKIGGYAFWIESPHLREPIKRQGVFKNPVDDSTTAEMMCLANALAVADKVLGLEGATLSIKTDSMILKKVLKGRPEPRGTSTTVGYIKNIMSKCKDFDVSHIKAHRKIDRRIVYPNNHIYINHWCDVKSRAAMRKAVGERLSETNIKPRRKKVRRKTFIGKQRQKALSRRMVRSGVKAYKRTKGNFLDEL